MSGMFSSPKAPKTPDPKVVAQAQADANIKTAQAQTELNRYNEVNPFGSQSWSRDPNNPNSYTLNTQYDPRVMGNIDKQLALSGGGLDFAGKVGQFGERLATSAADRLNRPLAEAPNRDDALGLINTVDNRLYDNMSNVQGSMKTAAGGDNLLNSAINRFGNVQNQAFNFNQAPGMPTTDEATRTAVADAIYNRATSRLDPQFQQRGSDLESELAARGITHGSDAYERELDNLMRARNDAYANARNDAETGSVNALNSQFANALAARQQGVGEANMIRDQFSDEARVANELAGGANQNAVNQMQTQVNRGLAVPAIANGLMDVQLKGTEADNRQRNQALGEVGAVNDIYKSLSNPGTNFMPTFGQGSGGAGTVGQTPVADSVYNSYSGDMNRYSQQVGSQNNMMSGLAGLGGAALMAPAGTFSGLAAGGSAALSGLMAF